MIHGQTQIEMKITELSLCLGQPILMLSRPKTKNPKAMEATLLKAMSGSPSMVQEYFGKSTNCPKCQWVMEDAM